MKTDRSIKMYINKNMSMVKKKEIIICTNISRIK